MLSGLALAVALAAQAGDAPPLLEDTPMEPAPLEATALDAALVERLQGWIGEAVEVYVEGGARVSGILLRASPAGVELRVGDAATWIEAARVVDVVRGAAPETPREPPPAAQGGPEPDLLGWALVGGGVATLLGGGCLVAAPLSGAVEQDSQQLLCFFCGGLTGIVGVSMAACGALQIGFANRAPAAEQPPAEKPRTVAAMAY